MKVDFIQRFSIALIGALLLLVSACSDPKFGVVRGQKETSAPNLQTSSLQQCSNFTLIRPQVDLLFIWDNSSSSVFINDQTRQALNRIVDNISNRFDYHIVLAPLIRNNNPVNWNIKLVSYDTAGLNSQAMSMRIAKEQAANNLNFPLGSGSREAGLERTRELIANNISNGIFRQGAYNITVLMSTEDDESYMTGDFANENQKREFVDNKIEQLLCLRGNHSGNCSGPTLNSSMMRFLSIVSRNPTLCSANGIQNTSVGVAYEYTSSKIYSALYTNSIPQPTDQNGAETVVRGPAFSSYQAYDSTDICRRDYNGIFDSVNSIIQDTVVNHKYNRWPVAGPNASVDPDSLVVRKSNGQEYFPVGSGSVSNGTSGYRYIGKQSNLATRFEPSVGEAFSGHMIELFGDAQVTYPECLVVTSTAEREFYGYALLGTSPPLESSIELRINGSLIPKCSSSATCANGWVYDGYRANHNIKVVSPTNLSPAGPADIRTGYFIKLFGNAVYTNGDNINVNWLPTGN